MPGDYSGLVSCFHKMLKVRLIIVARLMCCMQMWFVLYMLLVLKKLK